MVDTEGGKHRDHLVQTMLQINSLFKGKILIEKNVYNNLQFCKLEKVKLFNFLTLRRIPAYISPRNANENEYIYIYSKLMYCQNKTKLQA